MSNNIESLSRLCKNLRSLITDGDNVAEDLKTFSDDGIKIYEVWENVQDALKILRYNALILDEVLEETDLITEEEKEL